MTRMLTKIIASALVALGLTAAVSYKNILHNIMSHRPDSYTSTKDVVKDLPKLMFTRGWYDGVREGVDCVPKDTDLNAIYLGKQENPFSLAKYRPTSATIPSDMPVYDPSCLIDLGFSLQSLRQTTMNMLQRIKNMKRGDIVPLKEENSPRYYWIYGERLIDMDNTGRTDPAFGFGSFTSSLGYDEHGRYMSFFDIFDFQTGKGGFMEKGSSLERRIAALVLPHVGEPIYFYKRWYFDEVGITDSVLNDIWNKRINGEDSWFKDSPYFKRN